MYCGKRFSCIPPVYRIRNDLTALDHNIHDGRGVMRNKDGDIVYHRCYNKKVSEGLSNLARKRKQISPHSGSLYRKPSSVNLRASMV